MPGWSLFGCPLQPDAFAEGVIYFSVLPKMIATESGVFSRQA
jgi:hypothetical protein